MTSATAIAASWRPRAWRRTVAVGALGGVSLVLLGIAHLFVGTADLGPGDVVAALTGADGPARRIVVDLRAPRTLVAIVAGAMLGLAGALLQAITRNDLAEPGLLGIGPGAVLGVVATLQVGGLAVPRSALPLAAVVGGGLAALTVYLVGWRGHLDPLRLVLSGVLVGAVVSSGSALLLLGGGEAMGSVLRWLVGSLHARTWTDWHLLWPVASAALLAGLATARTANVLALGDPTPTTLGMRTEGARLALFLGAAVLTAGAVAVVGGLAFVGLLGPHLARRLVGDDATRLFPIAALLAALVLVAADVVATGVTLQLPVPALSNRTTLPVGAVTSLLGAPLLLVLLVRPLARWS